MKPRLLDLYCGPGGGAMGYHRAGFQVIGIDHKEQPHYPFEFHLADAPDVLESIRDGGHWFYELRGDPDAIHASPPCQAFSELRTMVNRFGGQRDYPDLVALTRELIWSLTPIPYVIENVPGAPLENPVTICGTAVGLPIVETPDGPKQVQRHRLFETDWPLLVPPCAHTVPALGTYGNGGRWKRTQGGTGSGRRGGYQGNAEECRAAMGIDWTTRAELAEAIPPAYTQLVGEQLLRHLAKEAA
jgi:DNA (cytosine-5)-methyltransferase 1